MLLTVTTTRQPATDLGFLLHKHPDRVQRFTLPVGTAHVCYPRADERSCTVALVLEVDPIGLVRRRQHGGFALGQYVNDRPYTAGSLLAVAIGAVFRTALNGRCDARPELAETALPLEITLPSVPCGPDEARRMFAPLGWRVHARPVPLDEELGWTQARYVELTLTGELRLADALNQLYVLLPVLDGAKHYWVAEDEVDKLVRAGGTWLAGHPERELIARRYLAHQGGYVRTALTRLAESDEVGTLDTALQEPVVDDPVLPLAVQRRAAVLAALRAEGARRVVDLGCGQGALLADLLAAPEFTEVLGVDVSAGALDTAERRLAALPERARERVTLRQSALTYADRSLAGYDAAVLMEVIEHVDPVRLPALGRAVFGTARPRAVVVTTPNADYNVLFEALPHGGFRHPDHRFEWSRAEFRSWAEPVAEEFGYTVRFTGAGGEHAELGPPTQLAVFTRKEAA